jgi:predicted AlkP superfamily phosphohydrolase/phosphomutase
MRAKTTITIATLCLIALACPHPSSAYIGPGAGFAFLSSFVFVLGAALAAFFLLLTLPVRLLGKAFRRKKRSSARVDRLVVLGLDGFDPVLAREFMDQGVLPNLSKIAAEGSFSPLATSNPPISPVAWSSFMTGTNPGKHNIFDFLRRDPRTYLPSLSSAEISMGKGKPVMKLLRQSVPFWKILGEYGVESIILKVPITFPPEKFSGLSLSGLCAPDLKGSQGTFALYTTREIAGKKLTSGYAVKLDGKGPSYAAVISGPPHPSRPNESLTLPLSLAVDRKRSRVELRTGTTSLALAPGEFSPWIRLSFPGGRFARIHGIAHFFLKSVEPELELYLSPINIDPEKPALPVSHPLTYSVYLAKVFGPFATLGLPQDTWALNEGALTDEAFLKQTWTIHEKLEEIFFHSLSQVRRGLLCCVFDASDVIQHEFWRYRGKEQTAGKKDPIEEMYRRCDSLAGKVREKLGPRDLLFIVSDHGFKLFRRGVNLNTWLFQNGYLALQNGNRESGEWFEGVDWSKTRAYAFGLSGLYLNRKGRERDGTVEGGATAELKAELIRRLTGLKDGESGEAISAVYDTEKIYRGPYRENAPDLIVGYRPGWRASWESVTGTIAGDVFSDNEKAWSADHCIDHRFVPGVFFSSRKVVAEAPRIIDLAPTVLSLFGIKPPEHMDGSVLEFEAVAR